MFSLLELLTSFFMRLFWIHIHLPTNYNQLHLSWLGKSILTPRWFHFCFTVGMMGAVKYNFCHILHIDQNITFHSLTKSPALTCFLCPYHGLLQGELEGLAHRLRHHLYRIWNPFVCISCSTQSCFLPVSSKVQMKCTSHLNIIKLFSKCFFSASLLLTCNLCW